MKRAPAMRLYRAAKLLAWSKGLGSTPPAAPPAVVKDPAPAQAAPAAATRKACEVIDQADDSSFTVLSKTEVAAFRERYVKAVGDDPPDAARPTTDQLSALQGRLSQGRAPYVDLALFGPYGDRIGKTMKFAAQVFVDGALRTKQVAPPSTYEAWVGSWEVFRSAMLMVGAATPASLDKYAMGIKRLWSTHGNWSVIQVSDDKCRSEQWDVLAEKFARKAPDGYNDQAPWNSVIAASAYSPSGGPLAEWWYYQVVAPLTYHVSKPSHAMNMFEGTTGTVTEFKGPVASGSKAASSFGPGGGGRNKRKASGGGSSGFGPPAGKKPVPAHQAQEICEKFNSDKCQEPCPHGRRHVCKICKGPHPASQCTTKKKSGKFGKTDKKGAGKGSKTPA